MGDLFVGEAAGAALVDAACFGQVDSFALAFADEGTFEFGDGADELALERCEGVGRGVGCEGEAFFDELDADFAGGEVGDDLLEVDE